MKFYTETKFQDFQARKIPANWKVVEIKDIASVKEGIYGKRSGDGSIVQLKADSIRDNGKINNHAFARITIDRVVGDYFLNAGDVLLNNRNSAALVGKSAIFRGELTECVFGNLLTRIKIHSKDVLPEWLLYRLMQLQGQGFLRAISTRAVNQALLKKGTVEKIAVPMPPISEQHAVIQVLDATDAAIELADKVIAKTERLKKGLMQQLLTQGIGHTEYKNTPIGKIPKSWEAVKLKDIVEIDRDSRDPLRETPDKTFLYVDIESVDGGTGKMRNPKRILGKEAPSRARRVIHENDVIMSTVRPYLKAFAIVPRELDNEICSTGFAVLSRGNKILPDFLLNVLFSDQTINQCNRLMVGGQYPALNQSQVSEIGIVLPPLSEQQKIAEIFTIFDTKLELEKAEKEKLERIKQGLMDLLLTGKVRIKVD